jgi:hypothetical protein
MSQLDDIQSGQLDNTASWTVNMPPPRSFTRADQVEYQKQIDAITGTRDTRPLMKLSWGPEELRWYPHVLGTDPPGYTFPICHFGYDADGQHIAAPRWGLWERLEPEQFAPQWEASRYNVHNGQVWDLKGPCPSERYILLRVHAYHDGVCCPCHGECECCGVDTCWGRYADPDTRLLEWIRKTAYEARNDSDVDPLCRAQDFTAPQAQRELQSSVINAREQRQADVDDFSRRMLDYWERKPVSSSGLRRTDSGIYLLN